MFDQLKQMKQLAGLLGNPQQLRQRAEALRETLGSKTVNVESGGGAVRIEMDGTTHVRSLTLDPAVIAGMTSPDGTPADRAMIEQMLLTAFNQAVQRAQAMAQEEVARATQGIDLGIDPSQLTGLLGGR